MSNDNEVKKELSVKQMCSKWMNKFAETFLKGNPYTEKDLIWSTYDYIQVINMFPNDNVEDIIIDMFKSNYSVLSYFNEDKESVDKNVSNLFRNNNCLNEFVDDFYLFIKNVVEPLGQSKNEIFKKQTSEKLEHFDKIDRVYNTGVMDWDFVKNKFDKNMDFWKVKEAVSWMVGFVENCDYKLKDLLILNDFNNRIDKNKTFDNIIEKINNASLTQNNPFIKDGYKYKFIDAKAGEVDVMLWDEKKKKIISMSATRDRGFKIEGNQFPRHYIKSLVLQDSVMKYYNTKGNKEGVELSAEFVQKLVRHKGFQKITTSTQSFEGGLSSAVMSEIDNQNVFARDLSIVRQNIKNVIGVDFHKNDLTIKDNELSSILAYGDEKVNFIFFGEVLEQKQMSTIQAGLTCLSYRDNFKRLGKFRMSNNASNIFMRNISKRFNSISPSEDKIDLKGQEFIIELATHAEDVSRNITNIQNFSEGNVYSEERSCLFKACSVMFRNVITELNKMDELLRSGAKIDNKEHVKETDIAIEKGIKFFFDQGISKNNMDILKDFFSDTKKMDSFILNFDTIKTSISVVPLLLVEFAFC